VIWWKRWDRLFGACEYPSVAISPDNKYLVWQGEEGLHRYRIKGDDLALEESGPDLGTLSHVEVSRDSKFVVARADRGILHSAESPVGWCVFDITKLEKPLATFQSGNDFPPAVDPVTGMIYVIDGKRGFAVATRAGQVEKSIPWSKVCEWHKAAEVQYFGAGRLLAHPKGNAVLLNTGNVFFFIEVPRDKGEQ
jgi:hypothetical protein